MDDVKNLGAKLWLVWLFNVHTNTINIYTGHKVTKKENWGNSYGNVILIPNY